MTNPLTITLRRKITPVMAEVGAMGAKERAYAAGRLAVECRTAYHAFAEMRRQAVRDMRGEGMSWRMIADLLGITTSRAIYLANKHPADDEARARASAEASEA